MNLWTRNAFELEIQSHRTEIIMTGSPRNESGHSADKAQKNGKLAPLHARQAKIQELVQVNGFVTIDFWRVSLM
jgi:hypothetical protein